MKGKIFFLVILIGAIFLPLFPAFAIYDQTSPALTNGSSTPKGQGNAGTGKGNVGTGSADVGKGKGNVGTGSADVGTGQGNVGTGQGNVTDGGKTPANKSHWAFFSGISIGQLLYNLELYAWIIFVTLAILMFIFAGILFLMAQGEPDKLKTVKSAFVWGIVGAVLAILAYAIRTIIGSIFNF